MIISNSTLKYFILAFSESLDPHFNICHILSTARSLLCKEDSAKTEEGEYSPGMGLQIQKPYTFGNCNHVYYVLMLGNHIKPKATQFSFLHNSIFSSRLQISISLKRLQNSLQFGYFKSVETLVISLPKHKIEYPQALYRTLP